MNKSELISHITESLHDPKDNGIYVDHRLIHDAVCFFFQVIKNGLVNGEKLEIRSFGTFATKKYNSYIGRNPKNGEKISVPPKINPYFKASKLFIKELNNWD
ncbi:MAG: integration host factor subunit beta [SAR324 cluster bacterium]|nr:integration host factor subunit beta [SAR324 cluster bacterium]